MVQGNVQNINVFISKGINFQERIWLCFWPGNVYSVNGTMNCPKCYTHPELVPSGWQTETLKCPVCGKRYKADWEKKEKDNNEPPHWWPLWKQGWFKAI